MNRVRIKLPHTFSTRWVQARARVAWAPAFILMALGCQASLQSAKTEDEIRAMVPVPICVQRLPRAASPGAVISLSPAEYWTLLLPSFDASGPSIDPVAADCSGRASLKTLKQGGAGRLRVDPERITVAPASDGMKIVWLQSHPIADNASTGEYAGLLALTRQRESYLEVYAVGVHDAQPERARFTVERMGPKLVVNAIEEKCSGEGQSRRCNAVTSVYLMKTGELRHAADFPVDQSVNVPGPAGAESTEYRFSASAEYHPDTIRVTEHLSVRNKVQGEIRSSDLERAFRLEKDQLVASGESLWTKTLRELGLNPRD